MFTREHTKKIKIGSLMIGGGEPIVIQSMLNTPTKDVKACISQIRSLEEAGCELIRLTVMDEESAACLGEIKKAAKTPLVADIHFDYRMALLSMEAGVDKIRINPGNLGGLEPLKKVVAMAKERQIPIRVGINSGSVEKDLLEAYGRTPKAMALSAKRAVEAIENLDYDQLVVSIKASNVSECIEAYRLFAIERDYPLHIGITEAGTLLDGTIKSALGIGALLQMGLGDTLRVSLTADPVEEVKVAKKILQFLDLRREEIEYISCPTCGRTQIDLLFLTEKVHKALGHVHKPLKIAIMGCVVNGPGEARECDYGIAGGKGEGLVFKKGEIIAKVKEDALVEALVREVLGDAE